ILAGIAHADARDPFEARRGAAGALAVQAEKRPLVLAVRLLVDVQRVHVRRVATVELDLVLEVVAVLAAVAVEPVDTNDPAQRRTRLEGEMRVEVDVVELEGLAGGLRLGAGGG